jgi:hypothetical protein
MALGSSRGHSANRRCPLNTAPAKARQVFSPQFPQLDFSRSLNISKAFFGSGMFGTRKISFPLQLWNMNYR